VQEVRAASVSTIESGPSFACRPGFGGSCFPKDVRALIKMLRKTMKVPLRVVEAVASAKRQQKAGDGPQGVAIFAGVLRGKKVAVLGLTFKRIR